MKALFAILFMFGSTAALHAQNFSAGLRAGAGYWMEWRGGSNKLNTLRGRHIFGETEAFIRRTGRKRWAFEGAIGTSSVRNRIDAADLWIECPVGMYDYTTYTVRNLDVSVSAQYDLMPGCAKNCPLARRLHSYAGFVVTGTGLRRESADVYERYSTGVHKNVSGSAAFWTGLSNTITFDLTKQILLTGQAYVRIAPVPFFASHQWGSANEFTPGAKAGMQLGAGYRFN